MIDIQGQGQLLMMNHFQCRKSLGIHQRALFEAVCVSLMPQKLPARLKQGAWISKMSGQWQNSKKAFCSIPTTDPLQDKHPLGHRALMFLRISLISRSLPVAQVLCLKELDVLLK